MVVINLFIGVISLAMFTAFDDLQEQKAKKVRREPKLHARHHSTTNTKPHVDRTLNVVNISQLSQNKERKMAAMKAEMEASAKQKAAKANVSSL
jgi:hypothetical protein